MSVLAALLPDSIDTDTLQKIIIGLLVVLGVLVFFVVRTVQKVSTRILAIALLVAVGAALWIQRNELSQCADQCTCRVFGQDVRVPDTGLRFCPE